MLSTIVAPSGTAREPVTKSFCMSITMRAGTDGLSSTDLMVGLPVDQMITSGRHCHSHASISRTPNLPTSSPTTSRFCLPQRINFHRFRHKAQWARRDLDSCETYMSCLWHFESIQSSAFLVFVATTLRSTTSLHSRFGAGRGGAEEEGPKSLPAT